MMEGRSEITSAEPSSGAGSSTEVTPPIAETAPPMQESSPTPEVVAPPPAEVSSRQLETGQAPETLELGLEPEDDSVCSDTQEISASVGQQADEVLEPEDDVSSLPQQETVSSSEDLLEPEDDGFGPSDGLQDVRQPTSDHVIATAHEPGLQPETPLIASTPSEITALNTDAPVSDAIKRVSG